MRAVRFKDRVSKRASGYLWGGGLNVLVRRCSACHHTVFEWCACVCDFEYSHMLRSTITSYTHANTLAPLQLFCRGTHTCAFVSMHLQLPPYPSTHTSTRKSGPRRSYKHTHSNTRAVVNVICTNTCETHTHTHTHGIAWQ